MSDSLNRLGKDLSPTSRQAHESEYHTLERTVCEVLLESEHIWTFKDIGTNAISGIITDPANPKTQKSLKGMDSIQPPPPTPIKKIKTSDFDPYIKSLADVFDKYQYNRAIGLASATEGTPVLSSFDERESVSFTNLVELTSKLVVVDDPVSKKRPTGLSHSQRTRILSANAPPLETVPSVFFDSNFDLGNPAIFAEVTEKADFSKLSLNDVNLTSTLLQDKLSLVLDTVDVHLIKEISRRSTSFFSALTTLEALNQETQSCVDQIHELRSKLAHLSQGSVQKGLEVARLNTRRKNVRRLLEGINRIANAQQTKPVIQSLLAQMDYIAALDLIDDAVKELKGHPHGDDSAEPVEEINLSGVQGIVHLNAQLKEAFDQIATNMEQSVLDLLMDDIRQCVSTMDTTSYISPHISGSVACIWIQNIASLKNESLAKSFKGKLPDPIPWNNVEDKLTPLVLGLLKIDKLGNALQIYKEHLIKEIKNMTRKHYPIQEDSPATPNSPSKKDQQSLLAKQLKSMTFDSFFNLLLQIYVTLLHVMQKSATVHETVKKILVDAQEHKFAVGAPSFDDSKDTEKKAAAVVKPRKLIMDDDDDLGSMDIQGAPNRAESFVGEDVIASIMASEKAANGGNQQSSLAQIYSLMISDSTEVLQAISDLSNALCAKLVTVRADQNAQLNPKDFYRLLGATKEFIAGEEALCGNHGIALKGAVQSQARAYLSHFHEERTRQLAIVVENEQWVKAEVPVDFQDLAQQIVDVGKSSETKEIKAEPKAMEGAEEDGDISSEKPPNSLSLRSNSDLDNSESGKYLIISGQKFHVAGCVLMITKMFTEYLQCMDSIPSLTTEVLNKILDLLKLFNSRICQVILGAGATKSAGLKNINAGHIALGSQSVGAILALVPHLRLAIQKFLPAKQHVLLGEFDKILRDYRDHQNELFAKLVAIMNERLVSHCKALLAMNWDSPDTKDMTADGISTVHMFTLAKETATLQRVLVKNLNKDTVRVVLNEVFKLYNKKFEEELKKIDLFTSSGKNRLLMDVQYLINALTAIEGADGPGNHLEVVVNNIKIKDKRTYTATSSNVPGGSAAGATSQNTPRAANHPGTPPLSGTRTSSLPTSPTSNSMAGASTTISPVVAGVANANSSNVGGATTTRKTFNSIFGKKE